MNLDALNDERVEIALTQLYTTDEEHALLAAEVKRLEELLKNVKAKEFLAASGTVAEREAKALASDDYSKAVNEWADKFKDFKALDNKRQHSIRVTEIWQTLSANRRKGGI